MTAARTFAVLAANRPAGTLEHDAIARPPHQVWRWRSACGAIEEFFQKRSDAKERIAWVAGCPVDDVRWVEREGGA